jgi:hypothetical protein
MCKPDMTVIFYLALYNHCHSHPATDAHRKQPRIVTLAPHVVHAGHHLPGAGAADGMAQ